MDNNELVEHSQCVPCFLVMLRRWHLNWICIIRCIIFTCILKVYDSIIDVAVFEMFKSGEISEILSNFLNM